VTSIELQCAAVARVTAAISSQKALKILEFSGLDFMKFTIFTASSNTVFRTFGIFLQQEKNYI
jgi:hypothetical protein